MQKTPAVVGSVPLTLASSHRQELRVASALSPPPGSLNRVPSLEMLMKMMMMLAEDDATCCQLHNIEVKNSYAFL